MPDFFRTSIGPIELTQIENDGFVDLAESALELFPREAACLRIDGFEFAAVDGNELRVEQVDVAIQRDELAADLSDRWPVILAEVRDGFEVGLQLTQQPDQFKIASAFPFQAARRLNLVEIAVEIKL